MSETQADTDSDDDSADVSRPDLRGGTEKLAAGAISIIPRLIPRQSVLFRKLALGSIRRYHKRAGGDALAIDAKAGQKLDLTPVKYRSAGECDEGEKPGWIAKDGTKTWNAASEGRVVDYLNNTPVVALDRDSHVECGWLRPRIAEAVELDNYDGLYTNPELNLVADASTNGHAVADGGTPELELGSPGQWAGDALVDLDSGDGYDGMRVSFRKATEWMSEQTTTQEMQMQEDRGYIRGLANGDEGPSVFKLLLLCAAIILGTLAIVLLGPELVSGGGGSSGSGGINPLIIGLQTLV